MAGFITMAVTPNYGWPVPVATDFVKDGYEAIADLGDAIDATVFGLPTAAGIGSNVVQSVKTDTFTTSSTSYVDITGLTATITPTSATSKILIIAQLTIGFVNDQMYGQFRLSGGNATNYVGDTASNRVRTIFGGSSGLNMDGIMLPFTMVYLDSPASTSAITYAAQAKQRVSTPGTVYVNRMLTDTDNTSTSRGASSITVIEVSA
jgi:hypothetical protein